MKNFNSFLFFICCYLPLAAQNNDVPVRFAAGDFTTGNNIQRQSFQKENLQASVFNNDYYVMVQFSKLPSIQAQQNLRNAGVSLETYLPGNAYFATIKIHLILIRQINLTLFLSTPYRYFIKLIKP